MRHDSVLSRPAKKTRPNLFATVFRRLLSFPIRGYAGAALTAVLTGIVVNALTLQHARHPAPFFAPHPVALATPAATPVPVVPAATPEEAVRHGEERVASLDRVAHVERRGERERDHQEAPGSTHGGELALGVAPERVEDERAGEDQRPPQPQVLGAGRHRREHGGRRHRGRMGGGD